jgi:ankyrin repeat protein/cell wall assembly regulator SMI1
LIAHREFAMDNPIRRSAACLGEEDIAAAEAAIGLRFPKEYRAFLLEHNGGMARRVTLHHTNRKGQSVETWLGWIYSIGHEGKLDPADAELVAEYKARPHGLPKGMLPVAYAWFAGNTGCVCIACEGPDAGRVFFRPNVEPDKDTSYPVALRWDRFLEKLEYQDEKAKKKWRELVQDGDAEGLRTLLEKNENWRDKHLLQQDVASEAVEEGHWGIIELLIEKGWSASDLFHRALGSRRFDLARGILRTGKVSDRAIQECLTESDGLLWYIPDFVAELVDHGADINYEDSSGETPLHKAVDSRSLEGVRFLIERGANPTVKNDDGRTPAALAQRLEEPAIQALLREADKNWKEPRAPKPSELEAAAFDFHGVTMTKAGPQLSLADIAAFERAVKLDLPPEYRGFLLKSNGGAPDPDRCPLGDPNDDEDEDDEGPRGDPRVRFSTLLPTGNEDEGKLPDMPAIDPSKLSMQEYQRIMMEAAAAWQDRSPTSVKEMHQELRPTGNPRHMLPIGILDDYGVSGGLLLISCKGKDKGKLYYRDGCYESHHEGADFVIDSLDALFRKLGDVKSQPATPNELAERAIKSNDIEGLKQALAQGANPLKQSRSGMRLVDIALQDGKDDAVMAMAEGGTKIDELFGGAVNVGRLDLARRLLDHGKGPSKKALAEALACAPLYGDSELVKLLLARGASAKKLSVGGGWTPLHFAAQSGNLNSTQLLLDAGADVNARAQAGQTPLLMAASAGGAARGMIQLLLQRGAKVNVPDMQGETALHHAVRSANLDAAKLLIEAGEDLHARHKISMPGMSEEEQERMSKQAAEAMQQMMGMLSGMRDPDEDAPPPIDTSTPMGEMLAKAQEAMQQRMAQLTTRPGFQERMQERMLTLASGQLGKGRSAAQVGDENPHAQALLPGLERLNAQLHAKQG